MPTIATQADLERLGLGDFRLGESNVLAWPMSESSEALGAGITHATFATMLAARFLGTSFGAISAPVLGDFQMELSQAGARVLKVSAPGGVSIQIHAPGGSTQVAKATYIPSDDSGIVYIDTEQLPEVVLRAGPAGLAIDVGPNGLKIVELLSLVDVAPLECLEPPIMEWVQAVEDAWLRDETSARVEAHNSWSRVVAAGMLARLPMPPRALDARRWLANFRAGHPDEALARPRRWMRELNTAQVRSVEELALAEVDALHAVIETVARDVDANASHWKDEWRDVCHRRDDLEGVLVLLDTIDRDSNLRPALADLDRDGHLLKLSVPPGSLDGDERARRAALKDPDAWWGELPVAS